MHHPSSLYVPKHNNKKKKGQRQEEELFSVSVQPWRALGPQPAPIQHRQTTKMAFNPTIDANGYPVTPQNGDEMFLLSRDGIGFSVEAKETGKFTGNGNYFLPLTQSFLSQKK